MPDPPVANASLKSKSAASIRHAAALSLERLQRMGAPILDIQAWWRSLFRKKYEISEKNPALGLAAEAGDPVAKS